MGQIQNALNQLAGSTMGLALGASHSPYIRGQRAIKQAGRTIDTLQEVVANESDPHYTQRALLNDIEKAYGDYENAIKAFGTTQQKEDLAHNLAFEATYRGGEDDPDISHPLPYLQYEAEWPGAGKNREEWFQEIRDNPELDLWEKNTVESIQKAYNAKRGVQNSVLERYQAWLEKPPVEKPANPGFKQPKPLKVSYQNPGYKPFAKPEVIVEKGETAPETPDTYEETATSKLDKPGSRLYKG